MGSACRPCGRRRSNADADESLSAAVGSRQFKR